MADDTAQTPPAQPPTIEDRLTALETRVSELESAVVSHAAPTIGEPHDAYSKLVAWFKKIRGDVDPAPASPPAGDAEQAAPPKA